MALTPAPLPMPSTRIAPGRYEVIGTSRNVQIVSVEAHSEGLDTSPGWHLMVDGEWWYTYPTKRAALIACQTDPTL